VGATLIASPPRQRTPVKRPLPIRPTSSRNRGPGRAVPSVQLARVRALPERLVGRGVERFLVTPFYVISINETFC